MSKTEVRLRIGRSTLARIHFIHSAIKAGKYPNVPQLAKALEASTRAIERDVEMMRDLMGAPIIYSYRRKGYYYEKDSYSIPPLRLTEGELIAVFLGERLLSRFKGHPYEKAIRTAYTKIQALFPESAEVNYEEIERTVSFAVDSPRGVEQTLLRHYQTLQEAIEAGKTVRADYYSASRDCRGTRLVDPYHLRFQAGAWYCIGYCHNRREIRMFALDRFHELELTEHEFKRNDDFCVDEYLGCSLSLERGKEPQKVVILFDSFAARWVRERKWHESQRLDEQPDGSLILRFTVSGLGEVRRWVFSFGSHAEVLAPEELREEIQRETKKMAEKYG